MIPKYQLPGVTAADQVSNHIFPSDVLAEPHWRLCHECPGVRAACDTCPCHHGATLCPVPSRPALQGMECAELHRGHAWRASLAAGLGLRVPWLMSPPVPPEEEPTCSSDPNSHNVSASAGFSVTLSHSDTNKQCNSFKDAKLYKPLGRLLTGESPTSQVLPLCIYSR